MDLVLSFNNLSLPNNGFSCLTATRRCALGPQPWCLSYSSPSFPNGSLLGRGCAGLSFSFRGGRHHLDVNARGSGQAGRRGFPDRSLWAMCAVRFARAILAAQAPARTLSCWARGGDISGSNLGHGLELRPQGSLPHPRPLQRASAARGLPRAGPRCCRGPRALSFPAQHVPGGLCAAGGAGYDLTSPALRRRLRPGAAAAVLRLGRGRMEQRLSAIALYCAPAAAPRAMEQEQVQTTLTWGPYLWFQMLRVATSTLSVCDFLGEKIASVLGISTPKYQYAIDEYYRMKKEEEEEEEENKMSEEAERRYQDQHNKSQDETPVQTDQPEATSCSSFVNLNFETEGDCESIVESKQDLTPVPT
uniref:Family with sequence similarity 177 member A1 n=1 Tax=Crocodylus porosus TaxID=8502 RepID=A0A7M4E6J6_CROPO